VGSKHIGNSKVELQKPKLHTWSTWT